MLLYIFLSFNFNFFEGYIYVIESTIDASNSKYTYIMDDYINKVGMHTISFKRIVFK